MPTPPCAGSGSLAAMGVFEAGYKKDLEVRFLHLHAPHGCGWLRAARIDGCVVMQLDDAKKLVRDAIAAGVFNDLVRYSAPSPCTWPSPCGLSVGVRQQH